MFDFIKNVGGWFWVAYLTCVKLNMSRIGEGWVGGVKIRVLLMTLYMDVPYSFHS